MYQYPESDLDRPAKLLALVGSFWSEVYGGGDLVQSVLAARAQRDAQNHLDMLELIASMSRLDLPVFRREDWYLLTLLESQRNLTAANLPRYDGTATFSEDYTEQYGVPLPAGQYHCWALPPELREVRVLLNRLTDASLTLVHGTDFFVVDGVIYLVANPFASDRLVVRELFRDNLVVDRQVGLWLYRGALDRRQITTQFGYVLGLDLPSGRAYKDLVNALFDGLVQGTTQQCVQAALAAICDVPLVLEATETVEAVFMDARSLWVTTDAHAYAFDRRSTALVQPGAVVHAGDPLVDTLRFYEFNRGQTPTPSQVRSLSVGGGFLAAGYYQDLTFANRAVPLVVDEDDPSGYTRVSFEVAGLPGDVAKFWDDVHAAGVARDRTLAMLLDRRPDPAGQPTAAALPAAVNPLDFLCKNVFRDNLTVVAARPGLFGPDALGLHQARLLRKIIPPHTAMIVLTTLEIVDDAITMDGSGDGSRADYAEDARVYLGLTVAETLDPTAAVDETVRLRQIHGRCV